MADFIITVTADDAKIIQYLATKTGVSGRQLIEQKISNWAMGQIQGYFIDKIKGKTTQELIDLLGDIQ